MLPAVSFVAWVLAQTGGGGGAPAIDWTQAGIAGACLIAVSLFARQMVVREHTKSDEREAFFTKELNDREQFYREELKRERERHDRESARIIAQRDGLITEFFQKALPLLERTNDVLKDRQRVDEMTIDALQTTRAVNEDVRRLLEARQP